MENQDYYKQRKNITIEEINYFVENYYKKWQNDKDTLTLEFSENLETIDELFYAYLLLFKQSFPKVKINLIFPYKKPKDISKHLICLNACCPEPFIYIAKDTQLSIPNFQEMIEEDLKDTQSKYFFPYILINKGTKLSSFEPCQKDYLEEVIRENKILIKPLLKTKIKEEDLAKRLKKK